MTGPGGRLAGDRRSGRLIGLGAVGRRNDRHGRHFQRDVHREREILLGDAALGRVVDRAGRLLTLFND
jgi:hypothetical protein